MKESSSHCIPQQRNEWHSLEWRLECHGATSCWQVLLQFLDGPGSDAEHLGVSPRAFNPSLMSPRPRRQEHDPASWTVDHRHLIESKTGLVGEVYGTIIKMNRFFKSTILLSPKLLQDINIVYFKSIKLINSNFKAPYIDGSIIYDNKTTIISFNLVIIKGGYI